MDMQQLSSLIFFCIYIQPWFWNRFIREETNNLSELTTNKIFNIFFHNYLSSIDVIPYRLSWQIVKPNSAVAGPQIGKEKRRLILGIAILTDADTWG